MVMDGFGYEDEGTRSRWLKIGGGVLAGAVLLAAGFGVGRLSAPASGSGGQQRASVSGQSGPGPTRVENGVPVGYAHTREGAVAAATNYVSVVDGPLVVQPDRFQKALDVFALPSVRPTLRSNAEKTVAVTGLVDYARQGRTVIYRTAPLAYRIASYRDERAQVDIWAESFIAVDGILAPRETWATASVEVDWSGEDWKLQQIGPYSGGSDGPVPTTTQPSTQSSALPSQLKDFKEYRIDVAPGG
jgi:hypothetical protein